MSKRIQLLIAALAIAELAGCASDTSGIGSDGSIGRGGAIQSRCAEAVAGRAGVRANDVVVTGSTTSEGIGHHFVYFAVPRARADWVCEVDRSGNIVDVYFSTPG